MAGIIIQVHDLAIAGEFLENVINLTKVSSSTSYIQLKDEISDTRYFLVPSNILNITNIGGIISITKDQTSFQSLQKYLQSSCCGWKFFDQEEKHMIIEGPSSITIICSLVHHRTEKNEIQSLIENLLHTCNPLPSIEIEEKVFIEPPPSPALAIAPPPPPLASPPIANIVPPPQPMITNFSSQIFGLNGFTKLIPNSREPMPFETPSFVGHVLFLVRTKPLDQFYRHFFENNQRMYIIQIQGKFKHSIQSEELFMGLESTCSMGMMSKSIGRGMLKLLSNSGGGSLRHSLGDSKNPSAFVTASLISTVDRMCITPSGDTPPPINREFPESKEIKSKRKLKSFLVDATKTYSFTIKGKNIDFCEWSTCGFRMMNPTNLATFIGNNPLRLVAFSEKKLKNPPVLANDDPMISSRRRPGLSYFLEIEIQSQFSTSSSAFPVTQESDSESDVEDVVNDLAVDESEVTHGDDATLPSQEMESSKLSVEELLRSDRVLSVHLTSTSHASNFSDASLKRRPFSSPSRSNSNIEIPQQETDPVVQTEVEPSPPSSSPESASPSIQPIMTDNYLITIPTTAEEESADPESIESVYPNPRTRSMRVVSVQLERISMEWTIEDMKYCPASIEINDYRMGRSRRVAYIISNSNSVTRLRSYMQLAEYIPLLMVDDAESQCGRFSTTEIRRRQLAISLKKVSLLAQTDNKIDSIWNTIFAQGNDLDENFLKKVGNPKNRSNVNRMVPDSAVDQITSRTNSEDHLFDQNNRSPSPTFSSLLPTSPLSLRMEGSVAVCTGRRSWSEEWAILTTKYFQIPSPQTAKHLRIPSIIHLGQIRSVNILSGNEKPFPNYEFFTIGTAARVYYFCVKNEYILSQWIEALLQYHLPSTVPSSTSKSGIAFDSKDHMKKDTTSSDLQRSPVTMMGDNLPEEPEACVVCAGNFSSTTSRVLNHRQVIFRGTSPSSKRVGLTLSKQILRQILHISKSTNTSKNSVNPEITDWIEFSEKVSLLQSVSLRDLNKFDLIAFFLNIYHTLLLHSFVVLGVPSSSADWRAMKTSVSYEIAGDIMTLRDIDEVILGNISNKIVFFNFLRIQLTQNEAFKQIESKKPKQLDPTLMFPSSRLYFGEVWDYSIPLSHVPIKDILNIPPCDWRVALCVTNGCADLSSYIYIYDGNRLNDQLDKRCQEILLNKVRVDPSPPSLLTSTPSISLPKSLSCLILLGLASVNGRVSPGQDPSRILNSPSSSAVDDPRLWLPSLLKYIQPDVRRVIEQIIQSNHRIYIFFDIPDYTYFKFLQLKSDEFLFDNHEEREKDHPMTSSNEIKEKLEEERGQDLDSTSSQLLPSTADELTATATSTTTGTGTGAGTGAAKIVRHSMIHTSSSRSETDLIEHDRSISLDSGREGSPLKKIHENSFQSTAAALQINLFSETGENNGSETLTKPPIPTATSPRAGQYKRTSIEDLRVALQGERQTQQQQQQQHNKSKNRKKSFFGWK